MVGECEAALERMVCPLKVAQDIDRVLANVLTLRPLLNPGQLQSLQELYNLDVLNTGPTLEPDDIDGYLAPTVVSAEKARLVQLKIVRLMMRRYLVRAQFVCQRPGWDTCHQGLEFADLVDPPFWSTMAYLILKTV